MVDKLINMINTAQRRIIICCPWLNMEALQEPLVDLVSRKKELIIYYRSSSANTQKFIDSLRDRIVEINKDLYGFYKTRSIGTVHSKLFIKDDKEIIISSKNLTTGKDRDAGVWSNDEEVIRHALRFVESLEG
ncbi:MAG TPA: hypothetical protein ENG09_01925 [Candidatus Syntrophoarchaeum butanivorans]|uniref:PLD phosphodiesterase domain-containing protein n=1 Tax=Candidatus Syntropharchaeum butanivorans TaxID=1839936 RepID=A0A7C1B9P0_9EURY|nr:hypothetical protein [Candidatus Syntrophoarchaeum butanivorans]